jgi:hypothetical protein
MGSEGNPTQKLDQRGAVVDGLARRAVRSDVFRERRERITDQELRQIRVAALWLMDRSGEFPDLEHTVNEESLLLKPGYSIPRSDRSLARVINAGMKAPLVTREVLALAPNAHRPGQFDYQDAYKRMLPRVGILMNTMGRRES